MVTTTCDWCGGTSAHKCKTSRVETPWISIHLDRYGWPSGLTFCSEDCTVAWLRNRQAEVGRPPGPAVGGITPEL